MAPRKSPTAGDNRKGVFNFVEEAVPYLFKVTYFPTSERSLILFWLWYLLLFLKKNNNNNFDFVAIVVIFVLVTQK